MALIQEKQINFAPDVLDYVPDPIAPNDNQGARQAQTNLEGGIFRVYAPVTFNTIHLRVIATGAAPTGKFLIYQAADGKSGNADLVASVTAFAIPAGGTEFTVTPAEGTVTLVRGDLYFLWGRDSGAGQFTMQTYANSSLNLLNTNVPAGLRPITFTTAIAASGATPATFDPTIGGDAIESGALNTNIIFRLENV